MRTDDNLFPTLEPATYAALKDSIEQFGVLVPVAKDQDGKLIDGFHRSKIAEELGVDFRVDVIKVDSDEQRDEIAAALNLYRRHLDVAERQEQVVFLRSKGHSLRAIAETVGVSSGTVRNDLSTVQDYTVDTPDGKVIGKDGKRRDAKRPTVVTAKNKREAEKAQQALAELDELPSGIIDAKQLSRNAKKAANDKADKQPPPELPPGEFDVIVADPPWRYEGAETESRQVENQYLTMKHEAICALSPPAADDCILFLWATAPKLPEALEVIEAWGFTYRTCMVWVKASIGMGYYARGRHELLLIAKRGNASPPEPSVRPDSVIEAPRGKHSEKPEKAQELIEAMYPEARRLEMFSRRKRDGWTAWGNQAEDAR